MPFTSINEAWRKLKSFLSSVVVIQNVTGLTKNKIQELSFYKCRVSYLVKVLNLLHDAQRQDTCTSSVTVIYIYI